MFGDRRLTKTYPSTRTLRLFVEGDPNPPEDGLYAVLASEGGCDDWAAYMESTLSRANGNTEEMINDYGHKIYQADAERLFPDWADRLTWRD